MLPQCSREVERNTNSPELMIEKGARTQSESIQVFAHWRALSSLREVLMENRYIDVWPQDILRSNLVEARLG